MTKAITADMERAMDKAVKWLRDRGGSGVMDRFGRVLAMGDPAINVDSVTWLRCVFGGRLRIDYEARRIYVPEHEMQSRREE